MITAASSKEVDLFISWSKIHGFGKELFLDSISEKTENIKYDREKRSVYVFFNNEQKNREEWLRIEMFTVEERDLFLDAVKYSERRIDLKRQNVG